MEQIIIRLTNLWILANRERYLKEWAIDVEKHEAHFSNLLNSIQTAHSTKDRGYLLPEQLKALDDAYDCWQKSKFDIDNVKTLTFWQAIGWHSQDEYVCYAEKLLGQTSRSIV